jgi:acetyl-CoA carboxylase biotin carboxyl carrier protein
MNYEEIVKLMKEMDNTALTKLEIEEEGFRICIEKAAYGTQPPQIAYPNPAYVPSFNQELIVQPHSSVVQGDNNVTGAISGNDKNDDEAGCKKLLSPMVGTFYAAPAPDKPPFVKPGDKVKKGQTVCIIEAMKLMNEIESEYDGEIVKILVNNEDMVEYGQPLFLIR